MIVTDHKIGAAVRVATRLLDEPGNEPEDVRATYGIALSQGELGADDLVFGESLLMPIGLLHSTTDHEGLALIL